ncbi:nuclear transport factor 2 family protein [Arthrobacter sp. AZCC_0090]|uniref:nuclear transport factor 2 family protein n=1 Tax=Arthrobacter sp. AZCC_0090 TaxID=2735881 RepID=UPI0016123971|nr:nuclear transport factor 2 family protein [Arthrobacter sp. AZCC_0090]MBB6407133.1 ketosteroid isomerase-like protein [Arthrobacter sp. AZCC_0090]
MGSTTVQKSLEQRLDELESRTELSELVAAYCEGVDRQNVEKFMTLWHDDASYLIPGGRGDFFNTDGIRQSLVVIDEAWKSTNHWTTNHVVQFTSADAATGRSDCFAICEHHDGKVSFVAATYDDEYERRADGKWRFFKRHVTRWFVSSGEDIKLLPAF